MGPEKTGSANRKLPFLNMQQLRFSSSTMKNVSAAETLIRSYLMRDQSLFAEKALAQARLSIEIISCEHFFGSPISARDYFRNASTADEQGSHKNQLQLRDALDYTIVNPGIISFESFKEMHRSLLDNTNRSAFKAQLRKADEYVGGSRYREFGEIPLTVKATQIPRYMDDLVLFCKRGNLSPITKAAIAHLQFVAIHPFERANGKTSMLLVQSILNADELPSRQVVPISTGFAITPHEYRSGIVTVLKHAEDGHYDMMALDAWVDYFATSCVRSMRNASAFEQQVHALQLEWQCRIPTRSDSATNLLIDALPSLPVFSTNMASEHIDRSFKRTGAAIEELSRNGVIEQLTEGRRNRIFECREMLDAFSVIEGFL